MVCWGLNVGQPHTRKVHLRSGSSLKLFICGDYFFLLVIDRVLYALWRSAGTDQTLLWESSSSRELNSVSHMSGKCSYHLSHIPSPHFVSISALPGNLLCHIVHMMKQKQRIHLTSYRGQNPQYVAQVCSSPHSSGCMGPSTAKQSHPTVNIEYGLVI